MLGVLRVLGGFHFLFMKRAVVPELLDNDSGTPANPAALSDLRRINRCYAEDAEDFGLRTNLPQHQGINLR